MDQRLLIVNADDFGLSEGVNRGVITAHELGIVTSASLMVRGRSAAPAAEYARRRAQLDVGLHLDFGEWQWIGGEWRPVYEVVCLDDMGAVQAEIERQLEQFHALVGAAPTHVDSHQHVHRRDTMARAVESAARRVGVPLRHCAPDIRYCGNFYGQTTEGEPMPANITADALAALIATLGPGVTELACHPGDAEELQTTYAMERRREVDALCDPCVRAALTESGVVLTRFSELPARGSAVAAPRACP